MPVEVRHGWGTATGPGQCGGQQGIAGDCLNGGDGSWLCCSCCFLEKAPWQQTSLRTVGRGRRSPHALPKGKERRGEERAWPGLLRSSPCSASDPHWSGITPLQVRMNEIGVLLERNHSKFNFNCEDQIMRCVKHVQPLGPLGWIRRPKTSLLCPQHVKSNVSQIVSKRLFTYAQYRHEMLEKSDIGLIIFSC